MHPFVDEVFIFMNYLLVICLYIRKFDDLLLKSSNLNTSVILLTHFIAIILTVNILSLELSRDAFGKVNELNNSSANFDHDKIFSVNIFANLVQDRINSIINSLQFASKDPIMGTLPYLSNLSETYHGIPADLDYGKRQAMNDILKINPDIASIYFVLPDGNIYIGEPYSHQEQLPRTNFADREWYKGVTATNSTYVSSVFLSASINAPAIAVAVPVFPPNHGDKSIQAPREDLIGFLVGIVNLKSVKETIDKIDYKDERFLVIDRNGSKLVDQIDSPMNTTIEMFDYFDKMDYVRTLLGVTSNQTLIYDQNNTLIFYRPISFEGGELIALLVSKN